MKITKTILKQIVKEETDTLLKEYSFMFSGPPDPDKHHWWSTESEEDFLIRKYMERQKEVEKGIKRREEEYTALKKFGAAEYRADYFANKIDGAERWIREKRHQLQRAKDRAFGSVPALTPGFLEDEEWKKKYYKLKAGFDLIKAEQENNIKEYKKQEAGFRKIVEYSEEIEELQEDIAAAAEELAKSKIKVRAFEKALKQKTDGNIFDKGLDKVKKYYYQKFYDGALEDIEAIEKDISDADREIKNLEGLMPEVTRNGDFIKDGSWLTRAVDKFIPREEEVPEAENIEAPITDTGEVAPEEPMPGIGAPLSDEDVEVGLTSPGFWKPGMAKPTS